MNTNKIYEGAQIIDSILGSHIIIGESTFVQNSKLEDYVQLNRRNMIVESKIGAYSYTGVNTVIKKADIGKFCSISWNVSITGNKHNYNFITSHPLTHIKSFGFTNKNVPLESKQITIGNDVWIGMNTCVLPGVKIGTGCVIGAGSVVTRDIPPYAIAVGNPAHVIKYRFSEEIIKYLLIAEWWNWPFKIIQENLQLFTENMNLDVAEELMNISRNITGGNKDE